MAEQRNSDLSYGHFGNAYYHNHNGQWSFDRGIKDGSYFEPLGRPATSILPSKGLLEGQSEHPSGRAVHQQAKSVAKRYPEVVPGLASLEAFAHASQYITSIVSVHDPLISDQLAFGKAVDLNARKSRAKNVPIIAVVAGEAGNAVRIARINLAQYCWKPDEDLRLAVPEIFPGEDAWWAGDGGPVQQIRFAEDAGEGSTWMVLRLLQSTVILRPQYHRSPIQAYVPEGGSKSHRVSTSRLDANPVLSLPIEKTGGVTHADIDINPWYHHQIAIVDQHGAWSLWVIERQDPKRGTYNINVWKAGHMYDDDESEEPHQNDGDGWGAICFAGNPSTLVICNRRNMAVFDVSGKPVRLGAPDIGLSRPSNWILDLRRSSLNRNHLFILTSSQIIWLHVSGAGEDSSIDTVHTGATVLMSWNHFRNDDDIGLRLQVQEHNAGYLILLYSRLSDLITTLELSLSSSPLGHEVSVSDPHMVPLATNDVAPVMYPKSRTATESRPIVSCIAVQPAEYKMRHDLTSPNYQTQGMQFYKLFTLRSDLSVCECLYVHRPEGKVNRISAPPYKIKSNAPRSAPVATEDSFVVEDQEIDITEVRNGMTLERFLRRGASEYLVNHEHTDWTVDSEVLYRISTDITASTISNESSSATENLDLRSSMESIRERLNAKAEGGKWSIESLLELIAYVPNCADIDDATLQLQDMIELIGKQEDSVSSPINTDLKELLLPAFLRPEVLNHDDRVRARISLATTYDYFIEHWLSPLSPKIPGRARIAREKILRQIVLAVCLASIGVCLRDGSTEAATRDDLHLDHGELPVRQKNEFDGNSSKGKGRQLETSFSPLPSSQISVDTGFVEGGIMNDESDVQTSLPTPDPTPSLHSANSMSSILTEGEDPACARLRQYAELEPQPYLPPSMSRLLSHWVQGMDPAHYDWERATLSLHTTSETEVTEDDARKKKRERRKQRLLQRRGPLAGPVSQPMPTRPWGSQPQRLDSMQGSSQMVDDPAPMSQVEPGTFGGRQALGRRATKQRKKRVAGF